MQSSEVAGLLYISGIMVLNSSKWARKRWQRHFLLNFSHALVLSTVCGMTDERRGDSEHPNVTTAGYVETKLLFFSLICAHRPSNGTRRMWAATVRDTRSKRVFNNFHGAGFRLRQER